MYLLHGIFWIGIAFAIFFTILRTTIRAQVFRTLSADDACVIFSRSHGPAESLSKASVRHHYSFLDQHLGGQILLLDFLQTTLCEYPKNKSRIYLEICFVFYYSGLCELPGDESQILQTNLKLFPFRYDNIG